MNYRSSKISMSVGIAVMLIIMLMISLYGLDQLRKLVEIRNSYRQTVDVVTVLDRILITTQDAETGQRGFIITGKPAYLEPYDKAVRQIKSLIFDLKKLIANNHKYIGDIDSLENVINDKFAELKKTIELKKEYKVSEAMRIILSDSGKNYMDIIRDKLRYFNNEQKKLLETEEEEQSARANYALLGVILISFLALLFQVVVSIITMQFLEARKEAEINLRAIQESVAEGLFQVDKNYNLVYMNLAGEKLFGYKLAEVQGSNIHETIHSRKKDGKDCSKENCQFLKIIKEGKLYHETCEYFIKKDGQFLPVEYTCAPLIRNGQPIGVILSMQDISEQKEIERRVSEFYSTVSHELRTPLTSIRGTLSLMEGGRLGVLPEKAHNLAKIARIESERLVKLINDILEIRKIEAGKLELKFEKKAASEIVDELLQSMEQEVKDAHLKLTSSIKVNKIIDCDPDRIKQVLNNLVSNAIKFSSPDSEIIISVEEINNDKIKFAVKDSGVGIAQNQISQLFGLFQQLDSSDSRPKGGTGLGLYICKSIVEQHGGVIGAQSLKGSGSTFWFELPVTKAAPLKLLQKLESQTFAPNQSEKSLCTVLLVEDDDHLRIVLSESLKNEGFSIIGVSNLKEARSYLSYNVPGIVLLDIQLPDGNGLDLFHSLRNKESTNQVPVVVITGTDKESGQYADPLLVDWIKKPFDTPRLLHALQLAFKNRSPGKARVLIADDDQLTRELVKQQIDLFDVECIEAADGITAVHLARTQKPDLIILDLAMPSLDGFEVVNILRCEVKSQSTALLVYTARDLTEEDKNKLTLGLSYFLTKSRTSEEEFVRTVKALLNGLISIDAQDTKSAQVV